MQRSVIFAWLAVAFGGFATAIICAWLLRPSATPIAVTPSPPEAVVAEVPDTPRRSVMTYEAISRDLVNHFHIETGNQHDPPDMMHVIGTSADQKCWFAALGPPRDL